MNRFVPYALLAFFLLTTNALAQPEESADKFAKWLLALKEEAFEKGYDKALVDKVLTGVTYKKRVIASDRAQAEFTETYDDYVRKRVSDWRIQQGRSYLAEHGDVVREAVKGYKVPDRVVVAIMGVETNYGTFALKNSLFDVLATLAFDERRGARFRKEIFAALEILDKKYANMDQLKSSWAGALGVPQFMPTSYLQYAVDHDGDGKKDIWRHGPDLYASVANYLSTFGWFNEERWARKVIIPVKKQKSLAAEKKNLVKLDAMCERYSKHLYGWRQLDDWNSAGIRRMNGTDLPKVNMPAALIVTHPENSHGYLVYRNFCTLMRYNPSFKYALSVGVLSDSLK